MKKIYFLVASLLIVASGAAIYWQVPSEESGGEEIPKRTRIDEAVKWDNFMKQDPALGYVPHMRMLDVYRRIDQLEAQASLRSGSMANAKWRDRGPFNVAGRTRIILVDKGDPTGATVFACGVTGGIWRTTNVNDLQPSWTNLGDFYDNMNISALAQDPNNPDILYFGTGEPHGGAGRGLGIWKSVDRGLTWNQLSNTANSNYYYVVRLFVHPETSDVYAATEAGLMRSQDQGATWVKVLGSGAGSSNNAITDIEYQYSTGDLYISDGHNGGGCNVYYSAPGAGQGDNGNWTRLTVTGSGFPSGQSRAEISVSQSNPNVLFAVTAAGSDATGIFRSGNKGQNWSLVSAPPSALGMNNFTRGQAWYDLDISIDPGDENTVIIGGIDLLKSTNGGSTWEQISQWFGGGGLQYVHADQHVISWDLDRPGRVFFGNDGGIFMSTNRGTNIRSKNFGYNVTQFYAHAMHPDKFSNYFLAGSQDNGSHQFDEYEFENTVEVLGGDGFMTHIDQDQPDTQFVSLYFGDFHISTDGGQSFGSGINIGSGFYTPSDYDNDGNILYAQAANGGSYYRWEIRDLGNNSGETISVSNFNGSVTHVYASDNIPNRIYLGSTAGRIYRIDDAHTGTSKTATAVNLPNSGNISCVVEAAGDANHLIATMSNYGVNSVWESFNGGTNWINVEGDLPDVPVNWAVFHPYDNDKLFLATDAGIWVTEDLDAGNTQWDISSTMPVVRTDMLQTRTSDGLVSAATHGRGLFSTDFLSPVVPKMEIDRVAYLNATPSFDDKSINSQKWLWDFGDGTSSSDASPSHNYSSVGTYTVSLTINDTVTVTDVIKVLPDRPVPYTLDEAPTYGGNFDENDQDFGVDTKSGTSWDKGSSTVFSKEGTNSGANAYVTGIDEQWYQHNTESYLYTPNFDLSEPAIYEFKFWSRFNFQNGFDGFRVEYSLDRGTSWSQLGVQRTDIDEDLNNWYNYTTTSNQTAFPSGSSYFTGYQATWREYKTDLNDLVGNSDVAFRFAFRSNETNAQKGVVVDDVEVTKYDDILETILRSFEGEFVNANSDEIILQWTTQPEYQCKGFTYFISENGVDFTEETSNFVGGQGSTADLTGYTLEVLNKPKNLYYFQLKVIGLDDSYFLSDIIVVNRDGENAPLDIKTFANPFQNNLNLTINQSLDAPILVNFYDAAGRLVLQDNIPANTVFYSLNTAILQAGTYIITFDTEGEDRVVRRVMKLE